MNLLTLKTTLTTLRKKTVKTAPKLLKLYLRKSSGKLPTVKQTVKTAAKAQLMRDRKTPLMKKTELKTLKAAQKQQKNITKKHLKKHPKQRKTAALKARTMRNKRKLKA